MPAVVDVCGMEGTWSVERNEPGLKRARVRVGFLTGKRSRRVRLFLLHTIYVVVSLVRFSRVTQKSIPANSEYS